METTPNAAAESAAPEQTPLEAVMGRLTEADQQVVLDRLGEADKTFATLKQEKTAAEQRAEAATKMLADRDADGTIVKDQIAYLRTLPEQAGAEVESDRLKDVPAYLDQNSLGHTHMALERVVQACSRALAGSRPGGAARPAKRRAVEAPAPSSGAGPATPAVEASGTSGNSGASVRNLLRTHFDAC